MESKEDQAAAPAESGETLREAIRDARSAQAERSDVIVDMRAAEIARLEILEEQLKPLVAELPADSELFDFALGRSSPPRYWIDMIAFVVMSRDRKTYRFFRDTRGGRELLREASDASDIASAVRDYVAHRIVERERALASDLIIAEPTRPQPRPNPAPPAPAPAPRRRRGGLVLAFLFGVLVGAAGMLAYAYYSIGALPAVVE